VDAEAHSEYLKGLYFEHIDTAVAITHFNNSIQRDSTFAPAFAELAMSYFWQAHQYAAGPPVPEMQPLARAAATKALQLDPSLAPAHLALGLLATSDYNWAEAQAQYQASLRLDPSCAECYHQYGRLIEMLGRNDEALVQVNQAIELDPINDGDRNQLAAIAFTARKYDLAITQFESLHEAADFVLLTVAYLEVKRFPEALATAKKCKGSDLCPIHLALVYNMWGRKREATKIINQFMEASRHRYIYPTVLARACIATDDRKQALKWLERAYEEKDPGLFWLKVGPIYDPLRSEPRFQALLQKLKFPD
jgi:tetratricopeptide (TPR) repeat protein